MAYFWELADLKDSRESALLTRAAGLSLRNSEYTLTSGGQSSHYFDLDLFLLVKENAIELTDFLVMKMAYLKKSSSFLFNKIALIDKGEGGPVGLILLMGLLTSKVEEELIIVRPQKSLLKGSVKGELNVGDKVLILSDVATTGRTIYSAAEKIHSLGGTVSSSLVIFDRKQGATENLFIKNIQLFSLTSTATLIKEKKQELEEIFHKKIKDPEKETILFDFGGRSSTVISVG